MGPGPIFRVSIFFLLFVSNQDKKDVHAKICNFLRRYAVYNI